MHPFWKTQDVVSEVVSLLPKADQVRIAQVNAALWAIAIPNIWRDVPNLEHFFNLFPSDLWNKTREPPTSPPQLNRELQDSDWTRFLFYSSSTRKTHYIQEDLRNVVPHEIWSHRLFSASFPNLESLTVMAFKPLDEDFNRFISLLLRPSLRRLQFIVELPTAGPLIHTLWAISGNKTLLVQEMSFLFSRDTNLPLGGFAEAIASQTNLRRLTISGQSNTADLAGCAKELPFLEEFTVAGSSKDVPEIEYQNMYFRSLTTFTASSRPALIHWLLRAIGSNRLAKLALTFSHSGSMNMSPEPLTEIQRFRPHLAHLELTVWEPFVWEDLAPVLNLTELQTFQLNYSGTDESGAITDDRLKQMLDAWPNLTQLVIDAWCTLITLTSLAYVATQRPDLRKLALTFATGNAMNPSFPHEVDDSRFTDNALEVFDVRQSRFDKGDEEKLEKLFRCWWPKARFYQTFIHDWDSDSPFATRWPDRTRHVG